MLADNLVAVNWSGISSAPITMETALRLAASCEIRNVIHFFTAKNELAIEIYHQLCSVFGEDAVCRNGLSLVKNVYWRQRKYSRWWAQRSTSNFMPNWCHCCYAWHNWLQLTLMKSWLFCHQILKLVDPLFTKYWLKTFNFQKSVSNIWPHTACAIGDLLDNFRWQIF